MTFFFDFQDGGCDGGQLAFHVSASQEKQKLMFSRCSSCTVLCTQLAIVLSMLENKIVSLDEFDRSVC